MKLDEAIADIEACGSVDELKSSMQRITESYGFASYNFLDAGNPHVITPFFLGTSGRQWETEYDDNRFVHVDPCVARARRTNTPFVWAEMILPEPRRGPKSAVQRLMEAAQDFGFREGLVVPCHFRDQLGRMHSASSVFYWKDSVQRFNFLISGKRSDLHLIMIYFIQRCIDLISLDKSRSKELKAASQATLRLQLSDRERDVLSWAGRGKTNGEIAEILGLSEHTVDTHMKHAIHKLEVNNKTHAVAKCIMLGIIDV